MVRVVRLERTVSWSQTRRDTNFAIPGYSISAIIPRRGRKSKIFCLWSFMWSKAILCRFLQSGKIPQTQASQGFAAFRLTPSRIQPRHSQTRRDTNFAIPGYLLFSMIPRRGVKIKIFLSVVIPVVKAAFVLFSATGGKPAIARVVRPSGLLSKPRMDRVYALPNVARYQLRHTRIGEGYAARSRTAYPYYIRFSPVLQGGNQPFRAAFRADTRSVASQRTPRSSRPMWP